MVSHRRRSLKTCS